MRPFTPEFVLPSAVVVAACLVALAAWWWRRRPDLPSLVAGALPVSVLVAPHAWTYDYVVLVPTAVVGVAIAAASRARPVAAAALAAIVVLVPWALYIVAFARNGEDLSAWLLVAAEALVIILVRRG
jgi:hypothetical protein